MQLYLLEERPENDDFSKETPFYTLAERAKDNDSTYKFNNYPRGRFFYFARNLDVPNPDHIIEFNEIFVFALRNQS